MMVRASESHILVILFVLLIVGTAIGLGLYFGLSKSPTTTTSTTSNVNTANLTTSNPTTTMPIPATSISPTVSPTTSNPTPIVTSEVPASDFNLVIQNSNGACLSTYPYQWTPSVAKQCNALDTKQLYHYNSSTSQLMRTPTLCLSSNGWDYAIPYLTPCAETPDQKWTIDSTGRIKSRNNTCLEMRKGGSAYEKTCDATRGYQVWNMTSNPQNVPITWPIGSVPEEETPLPTSAFLLKNGKGTCLTSDNVSGAIPYGTICNSSDPLQKWAYSETDGTLTNNGGVTCMFLPNGNTDDPIVLKDCDTSAGAASSGWFKWLYDPVKKQFKNNMGTCLSVLGENASAASADCYSISPDRAWIAA